MTEAVVRAREQQGVGHWVWLVTLFSIASFCEASFWGVMGAFTPLYLTHRGVPAAQLDWPE